MMGMANDHPPPIHRRDRCARGPACRYGAFRGGWAVRGFTLSIIVVFVAGVAVATFGASMVDARALKRGGRCGPVLLNSLTGPPFFMNEVKPMKPVLITTEHRGVFAGLITDDQDVTAKSMPLKSARMAIYWGTTKGVMQLAETGPTEKSKISAAADIPVLHDITAIFDITDAAWEKWQSA